MLAEEGSAFQGEQMMVTKRQRVITIETHRQTLIRSRRKPFFAWCDLCGRETLMLPPDQAAIIRGETERVIFRQIENGQLHSLEEPPGTLFVCSMTTPLSLYLS